MYFKIEDNNLWTEDGNVIDIETFKFLTGKTIDLSKRKEINVKRSSGHIRIYDTTWILGTIYRNDNKDYICFKIEGREAYLSSFKKISMISSNNPENWEIVK